MSMTLAVPGSERSTSRPSSSPTSSVLQRWRRQIASRTELAEHRGPRPFALVGYRICGRQDDSLVPLDRLSFVALFDERDDEDRLATRLLGVRATGSAVGLRIGGADQTLFDKNVRLAPTSRSGSRLDPQDTTLCELAFGWEQYLERINRHPHYPRRNVIRWPRWYAQVTTAAPTRGLRDLVPWETALAEGIPIIRVWADLTSVPKRQVVAGEPRHGLCGAQGPLVFDLYHSRFRRND